MSRWRWMLGKMVLGLMLRLMLVLGLTLRLMLGLRSWMLLQGLCCCLCLQVWGTLV